MKKNTVTGMLILVCASAAGQVKIDNVHVKRNGTVAEISFDGKVDDNAVKTNQKMILKPEVYAGAQAVQFPAIIIDGRRRRIMDQRNHIYPAANEVLTTNGGSFCYSATMGYQEWLQGASLRFDRRGTECGNEIPYPSIALVQNLKIEGADTDTNMYNEAPLTPLTTSVNIKGATMILVKNAQPTSVGPVVTSTKGGMTIISFGEGRSQFDPFNPVNRTQVTELISILRSARGRLDGRIKIIGYASPSGTPQTNRNIAQQRATTVRNYILDNVPYLRPDDFELVNAGINWEKLRELVDESSMPGRWEVLDIIDNVPVEIDYFANTSRKSALMNLRGGTVWNYMQAHFFSRVTYVEVEYQMSDTDTPDMRANAETINQAIDLIGEGNAAAALAELSKVSTDPRAWNPMGVAYVLQNNTKKARENFKKSIQAGYAEAQSNLDQLK